MWYHTIQLSFIILYTNKHKELNQPKIHIHSIFTNKKKKKLPFYVLPKTVEKQNIVWFVVQAWSKRIATYSWICFVTRMSHIIQTKRTKLFITIYCYSKDKEPWLGPLIYSQFSYIIRSKQKTDGKSSPMITWRT